MSAWKKPSRNTCVKKISTPARASAGMSMPFSLQGVDLRDRRAAHALHHHHALRAQVPVHRGHEEQRRAGEVAAELARVRRFAHQIELVVEVARELGHHLARLEAAAFGPPALGERRAGLEQREVAGDRRLDARAQHLDRDLGAVVQPAEMHLGDRGACHGLRFERTEHVLNASAERSLDLAPPPAPTETAAPGPAASPARRRCRAAAGRGAWKASGRT